MRQYYIASGILLILSTFDFAIAAPVLVQEKRQIGVDVMHMLEKRGDDLEDLYLSYKSFFENPESESSSPPLRPDDEWTDVKQLLPSIPKMPSPASSQGHESSSAEPLTEPGLMEGNAPFRPSSPASSSMTDADHELSVAHALPNPKPSTESSHEVHAPLSSQVFPTWFHPDHADSGMMAAHPSLARPNVDSGNRLVAEEPPSRPASPIESNADDEYEVVHPPSTNPGRRSMGSDSRLENHPAVSDPFKGNTKELRPISGTARDVLNAAQRELQPAERSLDPGE